MGKTIKTFKEYYDADPEFREKHLKKMLEKVPCECGFVTSRNNMTKHRRSRNHEKRMEVKVLEMVESQGEIKILKKRIARLEKKLQKVV